jgi:hypothetical protein
MKRALTALWLLLILTAVSTGSGIAWASSSTQGILIQEDPPNSDVPSAPGDATAMLGDPDDAITGNRGPNVDGDGPPFSETLSGVVEDLGLDTDDWFLLWMILLDLGLI